MLYKFTVNSVFYEAQWHYSYLTSPAFSERPEKHLMINPRPVVFTDLQKETGKYERPKPTNRILTYQAKMVHPCTCKAREVSSQVYRALYLLFVIHFSVIPKHYQSSSQLLYILIKDFDSVRNGEAGVYETWGFQPPSLQVSPSYTQCWRQVVYAPYSPGNEVIVPLNS